MVLQWNHLGKFACACAFERQISSLCLSLPLHKRAKRQSFLCLRVPVALNCTLCTCTPKMCTLRYTNSRHKAARAGSDGGSHCGFWGQATCWGGGLSALTPTALTPRPLGWGCTRCDTMGHNGPRPLLVGPGCLELRLQLLGPEVPVMGTCGGIGQPGLQVCNPLVLGVTLSMGNLQLSLETGIGLPQGGQGSPAKLPDVSGDVQPGLPYQDRPPLCPFRLLPLLIYSGSTIAFLKFQGSKSKNIENTILLQP